MKWKGIYSHRIFTQLVVFTLLISLIPTLSITSFLFYKLENMVKTELSNSYRQMTSQYIKNIDEKLTQYQYSLDVIADNTVILEALVDETKSPYIKGEQISSEVTKSLLLDRQKEIRNCMLYSDMDEYPVYGKRASMVKEAGHEEWFLRERAVKEGSFSYISSAGNIPVLSFVKNMENVNIHNYEKKQLGFLKLDLYMELVFKPANTDHEKDSSYDVIVYSDKNELLYSSAPRKDSLLDAWLNTEDSAELLDGFTVKHENLKESSLNVLLLFDNHQLAVKQQTVRQMVLPILLGVTLLIIFWAWLYSRNFSARIGCLVQKFHKAETGDLNIYGPIAGNDEVSELDRQFSHMLKKLNTLIQKNYIRELENKEAQLKNLQLQINPHFLYNTLNSIKWMATIQNTPGIAEMTTALARLMKNVSKGTDVRISLGEELDLVRDYFLIQQYRYGGSISIEYEITDEDLYQCQIHRFTLQPLVENALFHGIEPKGCAGKIVIRAEKAAVTGSRPALVISITDGGVGMSPETIRSVLSGDASPSADFFKQVGINNVDKRIKYSFGPEYGIRIESVVDEYTTMVITLPYMISERI